MHRGNAAGVAAGGIEFFCLVGDDRAKGTMQEGAALQLRSQHDTLSKGKDCLLHGSQDIVLCAKRKNDSYKRKNDSYKTFDMSHCV